MISYKLLETLDAVISGIENFLESFEAENFFKKVIKVRNFESLSCF